MDVIEVRREPCRGTPKFRRLQAAAAAPSAVQRKRTSGCGSDRSLSSPPVKQLRFDNCCSDAFVWEIEEAPKEPTFGKVGHPPKSPGGEPRFEDTFVRVPHRLAAPAAFSWLSSHLCRALGDGPVVDEKSALCCDSAAVSMRVR
ncbi:hypothetical protein HPB47_010188 [Ixodes persulcatus]|uniref:Uncharacterized protein n=1 Tax=Ixodes persulcatus TaxID=34615 RepID=A0AC60P047_IXOPE|nr:hypothetical protein HPB47_010188 [Ixodes persulcatus]